MRRKGLRKLADRRQGNGLIIMAVTAAAIASAAAVGISRTQQAQFSALNSAHKMADANVRALDAADLLKATGYNSLGLQAVDRAKIDGTSLYKTVTIGEEKADAAGKPYRICSVAVYDTPSGGTPLAEYQVTRAKFGTLMYDITNDTIYDTAGDKEKALSEYAAKQLFLKHEPGKAVGSNVKPVYVKSDGTLGEMTYAFNLDTINNSSDRYLVRGNNNSIEIRELFAGTTVMRSSTAAADGAKVATTTKQFTLAPGVMLGVVFDNPPTNYSTLNANNTGAKPVRILDSLLFNSSGSMTGAGKATASGRTDADKTTSSAVVQGTPYTDNTGTRTDITSYTETGHVNTTYFTTTTFRIDKYENYDHYFQLTGELSLSGSGKVSNTQKTSGYGFAMFVYDGTYWNLVGNAYGKTIEQALSGSVQLSGSIGTEYGKHTTSSTPKTETLGTGTGGMIKQENVIDYYTFTINQSANQTITVYVDGVAHTSSFTVQKGKTWTATLTPASNYNAGTLSATSGKVTGNTSISATAASSKTISIGWADPDGSQDDGYWRGRYGWISPNPTYYRGYSFDLFTFQGNHDAAMGVVGFGQTSSTSYTKIPGLDTVYINGTAYTFRSSYTSYRGFTFYNVYVGAARWGDSTVTFAP